MSHPEQPEVHSKVEILRVTLLSLEGIELSEGIIHANGDGSASEDTTFAAESKKWRVTAWAGFRSSFPTGCLMVPTSHYSTIFEQEGNLLAVESGQIELESSGPTGRVHWQDPLQCEKRQPSNEAEFGQSISSPLHHLQVILPSTQTYSESKPAHDDILLPDIIEIHICVACSFISGSTQDTSCSQEHFSHGIAHLKIPPREQSTDEFDLSGFSRHGGKVVILPIRTKPSVHAVDKTLARFAHNAMLSLRVEKLNMPSAQFYSKVNDEQRHYIESDWNGESCAPASINSFESEGRGNHIVRAGQIINDIRQTFSSQISNLRKSDEEQLPSQDMEPSPSKTLPKKSLAQLLKFGCGELGDVLQGDEMGLYDQANTFDSSLATADVMGR